VYGNLSFGYQKSKINFAAVEAKSILDADENGSRKSFSCEGAIEERVIVESNDINCFIFIFAMPIKICAP
jgi:hypothetical protein